MRLVKLLPPRCLLGTLVLVIRHRGEVGGRFESTQVRIYLIKVDELSQRLEDLRLGLAQDFGPIEGHIVLLGF